jgi:cyclopropane fatty-acyl-phospholipid synthase-like methyltransferase
MTGSERSRTFDQEYAATPPWDIGAPQPEIVGLLQHGEIAGEVLDAGCGSGENALECAARGHRVWGVDFAPTAIAKAQAKARARGLAVHFEVVDALRLGEIAVRFDTVIDCGLFHTFSDEERPRYVDALNQVLRAGGRVHVLCFSEREPNWGGPRRVTQEELRASFEVGFSVNAIRPARFSTNRSGIPAFAWLGTFSKARSE